MSKVVKLPTLSLCSSCGNRVATGWRGTCFDCAPSTDKMLKSYSSSVTPSRAARSPVGMELELIGPGDSYNDARATVAHLSRVVCSDGSINGGGGEIKVCSSAASIASRAADVTQRARLAGCRADESCGLHVHLSLGSEYVRLSRMSPLRYRSESMRFAAVREYIGAFLHGLESELFSSMPRGRRNNEYCKKFGEGSGYVNQMNSHYRWASLSSRFPTVEIRLHGSTVNPWKVVGWVEFCKELQNRVRSIVSGVMALEDGSDLVEYRIGDWGVRSISSAPSSELGDKWARLRANLWGVDAAPSLLDVCKDNAIASEYISARIESRGNLPQFRFRG